MKISVIISALLVFSLRSLNCCAQTQPPVPRPPAPTEPAGTPTTSSQMLSLTLPCGAIAGETYEFRYLTNNSFTGTASETHTDSNGTTQTSNIEKDDKGEIVKVTTEKTHADGSTESEVRELGPDGTVTVHQDNTFGPEGDVKQTVDAKLDKDGNTTVVTQTVSATTKETETKHEDTKGNTSVDVVRTDNLGTTTTHSETDANGNSTTNVAVTNNDGSTEGWTQTEQQVSNGQTQVTTTYSDGKQTVSVRGMRDDG